MSIKNHNKLYFGLLILILLSACREWNPEHAFGPVPENREEIVLSGLNGLSTMGETPEILLKKTQLLIDHNRITAAHGEFEKINPEQIDRNSWLWTKCQLCAVSGQHKEAIKAGEELLANGPTFYDLHILMAKLYSQTNDYENAFVQADIAVSSNPKNPESYQIKGDLALQLNDTLIALNAYQKVYKTGNYNPDQIQDYISLLINSGKIQDANEVVYEILKENPADPEIILLTAKMKYAQGDLKLADNLCTRLLIRDSTNVEILLLHGKIKFGLAQYDSTIYYTDLLLDINPHKEAYQLLGKALDKKYKYQEALNAYYLAFNLDSSDTHTKQEINVLQRKIAYVDKLKRFNQEKEKTQDIELLQNKPLIKNNQ